MVSGLPGTGKSALADRLGRHLPAAVLSVDPIEAAILRSGFEQTFETGLAAYEVVATVAASHLRLGLSVIVDAVRLRWRSPGTCGAGPPPTQARQLQVIEVVCGDADVHRRRLEDRERGIEGFPEPSWD